MPYTFRKQRFCHLSETGTDRKRTQFLVTPPLRCGVAEAPVAAARTPEVRRAGETRSGARGA